MSFENSIYSGHASMLDMESTTSETEQQLPPSTLAFLIAGGGNAMLGQASQAFATNGAHNLAQVALPGLDPLSTEDGFKERMTELKKVQKGIA